MTWWPLLRPLADNFALDDSPRAVRRVLEGIAVEEGQVAILAGFDRAHAVRDAQDLGGIPRDHRQGLLEVVSVPRRQGRLEQDHAHLGHVTLEARLEGDRDAGLAQLGGRLEAG